MHGCLPDIIHDWKRTKSIIVDATHTKSRYNQKTPRQVLQEQSKNLRRSIYEIDETMKEKFLFCMTEEAFSVLSNTSLKNTISGFIILIGDKFL